ncbi:MAG TPA: hypothetical protein VMB50_01830 [Myxococcales bacterium]|nr:hypothetical protein [Myxococcales bacterium]
MPKDLVDALNRATEQREAAAGSEDDETRREVETLQREFPRLVVTLYWRVERLLDGAKGLRVAREAHTEPLPGGAVLEAPLLHVEYFERKLVFQPFTAAPAPFKGRVQVATNRPRTARVNIVMAEHKGHPGTWKLAILERLRAPTRHKTSDLTDAHLEEILEAFLLE